MHGFLKESVVEVSGTLAVVRVDEHYRVLVTRPVEKDEILLRLDGNVSSNPSRFSVQIGRDQHLELPLGVDVETVFDRYAWRFLNHSCEPTAYIRGRELRADKSLRAWEQVTFDYNSTEFDMAAPFACTCLSVSCRGLIRGYRWLSSAERAACAGRAADHLSEALLRIE